MGIESEQDVGSAQAKSLPDEAFKFITASQCCLSILIFSWILLIGFLRADQ